MTPHKYLAVEFGKKVVHHMKTKNPTLYDVLSFEPKNTGIRYFENKSRNWFVLLPPTETTWAFVNLRLYQELNSNKLFFGISFFNDKKSPDAKKSITIIDKIQKFINKSEFSSWFEPAIKFKPDKNKSPNDQINEGIKNDFFRFWKFKNWEFNTDDVSNYEESVESLSDIIIELTDFFKHLILEVQETSGRLGNRFTEHEFGKQFMETDWSKIRLSNSITELKKLIIENNDKEAKTINSLNSTSIVRDTKSIAEKIDEKLKEYQRKLEIGFSGEEFVFNSENELVSSRELGYEVVWESQLNDSAGYDIQSWDENGNKIFIEVKSTTTEGNTSFFMSKNELEVAHKMQDSYYIYMVYLGDDGPQILEKIKNPAKEANYSPLNYTGDGILTLEPVSFKVSKRL